MRVRKILISLLVLTVSAVFCIGLFLFYLMRNLPQIVTLEDYKPPLVSEVYDVYNNKIGEFFREKRILTPYEEIPPLLVKAFIAAEDDTFFEHGGINYLAVFRALFANIKAGSKVQGASTITQQVARTLLLTRQKTYMRKMKEVLLSYKMEANLTKEEILYLYLNQIYFGSGAYGINAAAHVYFHKSLSELTLEEMAMLAGLPKAPSRFSPLINPKRAMKRQKYVLSRMRDVRYIDEETYNQAIHQSITVYHRENYREIAPYFLETLRQYLVEALGEETVLDRGIRIYSTLDKNKQLKGQKELQEGLHAVDKRQGYRGATQNFQSEDAILDFLLAQKKEFMDRKNPKIVILSDGTIQEIDLNTSQEDGNIPKYIDLEEVVQGVVTAINDKWGLTTVRFDESQEGLIDIETMKWARTPNPEVAAKYNEINQPSKALNVGDVIWVKVVGETFHSPRLNDRLKNLRRHKGKAYVRPDDVPDFKKYAELELEQKPLVEGALLSFDLDTQYIEAMSGGYAFNRSEFNRTIQSTRQTGSAFKPVVYAAALDYGYTPVTVIVDSPIVYQEELPLEDIEESSDLEPQKDETQDEKSEIRKWKPSNYGRKFSGDILFRNALIKSKNIPTIKILEKVGISRVAEYARRLGVFSPLNMDLSLGLGSSGSTLYEITKLYSHFARGGKRIRPIIIRRVESREGEVLLENVSLDMRFEDKINAIKIENEKKRLQVIEHAGLAKDSVHTEDSKTPSERLVSSNISNIFPPLYFNDIDQLITPQTAFLVTDLLKGVVYNPGGTGAKARALDRPNAGKTGTTSEYYDAWYVGYTRQKVTGVWVGYDEERTLGVGEVGGAAALPIWVEYMKFAHENLPKLDFQIPENIVFANIDNKTGHLASASTEIVVRQAFLEGTEPQKTFNVSEPEDDKDFFKRDFSE